MPTSSTIIDALPYFSPLIVVVLAIIIFLIGKGVQKYSSTTDFNIFTEKLKTLSKFLFFKPYPKNNPTKAAEISFIRIDNDEALKYKLWWGDDENEQNTILNRIKSHLNQVGGSCSNCNKNPAVVGYYENNELDYPDDVSFEKVVNKPRNICFSCFINIVRPIFNNKQSFPSIDYEIPSDHSGSYLFYFIDFG